MLNHSGDDAANTFPALFLNSSSYGLWWYAEFQDDGKQTGFDSPTFYELFDLEQGPI